MKRLLSLLISTAAFAAAAVPASATQLFMEKLPVATSFRCLNCHSVQDPTAAAAALNPFGRDFKANGFKWDTILAAKSSDDDNCTNGFELGDADGNGTLDEHVTTERYNPGQRDCTLQLNQTAWTALKQLFR
jgi:hypothetical protein